MLLDVRFGWQKYSVLAMNFVSSSLAVSEREPEEQNSSIVPANKRNESPPSHDLCSLLQIVDIVFTETPQKRFE
ncbi:hypothetical protein CEXT_771091 [Caerostris extrusa]|uniref:Uncharacterized protein n=1 Tax=Caerostris extrusa TaxID=172846 RepID=A0AAV4PR65_CAEEX|nr:hypothetical protein CEXT_771091 [Caerostris extrusa]